METTEVFEKLKVLQDVLKEKYALQKMVDDAPRQLSGQEELLARYRKDYIAKDAEYSAVKDKVAQFKFDLDEAVRSREDGEKAMDNITTHREYEALEKQISEAKAKEDDVRVKLQKEEKNLEEIKEDLNNLEEDVKTSEETVNQSKEKLNSQLDEYNNQLAELKKQEDEISPSMDQEILFKFQRIIQRNSEGIVAVRGGVCTGCHMILPAQFVNVVRSGENIEFCPYCSRILFYEETEDSEVQDFSEFAGSLADDDFDDEDFEDESEDKETDQENEDSLYEDSETSEDAEDENEDQDSDDEEDEESGEED